MTSAAHREALQTALDAFKREVFRNSIRLNDVLGLYSFEDDGAGETHTVTFLGIARDNHKRTCVRR